QPPDGSGPSTSRAGLRCTPSAGDAPRPDPRAGPVSAAGLRGRRGRAPGPSSLPPLARGPRPGPDRDRHSPLHRARAPGAPHRRRPARRLRAGHPLGGGGRPPPPAAPPRPLPAAPPRGGGAPPPPPRRDAPAGGGDGPGRTGPGLGPPL